MSVMTNGTACCFSSCAEDVAIKTSQGWRELTAEEIAAAGMAGYENLVSPNNATVGADGIISFLAPSTVSSQKDSIKLEIANLESQQTDRRIREATLTDEGKAWLQNLNDQIVAKRAQLAAL